MWQTCPPQAAHHDVMGGGGRWRSSSIAAMSSPRLLVCDSSIGRQKSCKFEICMLYVCPSPTYHASTRMQLCRAIRIPRDPALIFKCLNFIHDMRRQICMLNLLVLFGWGCNWSGVEPSLSLQPRLPHGLPCVISSQVRACGQWPVALSQCSSPSLPGWGQGCGIRALGSGLYRLGHFAA